MRLATHFIKTHNHPTLSGLRRMSSRTYQNAVNDLNSLQSNAAVLDALRATGGRANQFAIPEMIEYLGRIGYTPNDLNKLNVIHITGTKGKGSTSAFTDSILRHTKPDWKIGLYTSPHLVAVRERIRINGSPLSEGDFTKYFYQVWDKLQENTARQFESTSLMPGYFRFLTLLAFHTLLSEKVDATILEVGVGGTYDSTNIVPRPVVTGVTALGLDHVNVLGKTLKEIAWQKGGIYKEGVPAFTVEQPVEALEVLEQRATELKASQVSVVPLNNAISGIRLGLSGAHQYQNASLAIELTGAFLHDSNLRDTIPESYMSGLKATKWPGRCQTVLDPRFPRTTWYLDGAHTSESMECCLQWFASSNVGLFDHSKSEGLRILLFNCTQGRSGASLLRTVHETVAKRLPMLGEKISSDSFFDHVIFCTNVTYADGHFKGDLTVVAVPTETLTTLAVQHQLASSWSSLMPSFPPSHIHVLPTIEDAVQLTRSINTNPKIPIKVLVTGSLHLVGGLIEAAGLADQAL
ncbi:Mur ligase [Amanita rubescens]|nr:Mur ligase [Amanita rubescens]